MLDQHHKQGVMWWVDRRVMSIMAHPNPKRHTFTMLTVGDEVGIEDDVRLLVSRVFDSWTGVFGRRWRICQVIPGEWERGNPTPVSNPPSWMTRTVYIGDPNWMLEKWPVKTDLAIGPVSMASRLAGFSRQGGLLLLLGHKLENLAGWRSRIEVVDGFWLGQKE